MRTLIACTILALTAVGCGTAATSTAGATGAARPRAAARPARGLLRHRTPRPPGVSRQFNYVAGAGPSPCMGEPAPVEVLAEPFATVPERPGEEVLHNDRVTFGQPIDVCFNHLGDGPIAVTVDEPGHRTIRGVLAGVHSTPGAAPFYDWVPAIDDSWPLGRYTISARAGARRASTSVRVVAPWEPGLRVFGPSTDPGHNLVPPHSLAKVFLTGFRAGEIVRLTIYRQHGISATAHYYSSAPVRIPAGGNAIAELATGSASDRTTYIAVVRAGRYTLFGLFNVGPLQSLPYLVVGALPAG